MSGGRVSWRRALKKNHHHFLSADYLPDAILEALSTFISFSRKLAAGGVCAVVWAFSTEKWSNFPVFTAWERWSQDWNPGSLAPKRVLLFMSWLCVLLCQE